jgi:hypothetical protein
MPEEKPSDDFDKVLSDLKGIEDRNQALIEDLLRQKAEAGWPTGPGMCESARNVHV